MNLSDPEKLLHIKKQVALKGVQASDLEEVRSYLEVASEVSFSLHTKAESYLNPFCLSHLDLVETAYQINRIQVERRLEKALEKPVRSGPLKFQIQSERAELTKLDEEIERLQQARQGTFKDLTSLFHLKGCFYHVYTAAQRLLLDSNLLNLSGLDQKSLELVLDFLILWMESSNIKANPRNSH